MWPPSKAETATSRFLKNLEIFNDIYKQLDMFYVDSLSAPTR